MIAEEAKGIDAKQIHQCNTNSLPVVYDAREYIQWILHGDYMVYVVKIDKKVIGYVLLRKEKEKTIFKAHIMSFAVDKKHRRKGVGRLLMDVATKAALEKFKVNIVTLNVIKSNKSAIDFYKAIGYKKRWKMRNYYGRKIHGLMMIKEFDVNAEKPFDMASNDLQDFLRK
jgi:ribosomal protein S18 acetylase RimI-like enzyme